jgi:hypothetical protein
LAVRDAGVTHLILIRQVNLGFAFGCQEVPVGDGKGLVPQDPPNDFDVRPGSPKGQRRRMP